MNKYIAFYNGKKEIILADTSYSAQCNAARVFNVSDKKSHLISVMLAEKDGQPIIHSTANL